MNYRKLFLRPAVLNLIFALLIAMIGCSSDDDNSNPLSSRENSFVGTWVLTKVTLTDLSGPHVMTPEEANWQMTIIVNSDKSFSLTSNIEGESQVQNGTWSLNGDIISLASNAGTQRLPYTVDGNKFTISIDEPNGDVLNNRLLEFTKQ